MIHFLNFFYSLFGSISFYYERQILFEKKKSLGGNIQIFFCIFLLKKIRKAIKYLWFIYYPLRIKKQKFNGTISYVIYLLIYKIRLNVFLHTIDTEIIYKNI